MDSQRFPVNSGLIILLLLLCLAASRGIPVSQPEVHSSVSSNSSSTTLQHASFEQSEAPNQHGNDVNLEPAAGGRKSFEVGNCAHPDEHIYSDNTVVENGGPSTINGTIEIYIQEPVRITCIRIVDLVADGTGIVPWIHSGGLDESWVFIGVQTQYGKGFSVHIELFGVPVSS